MLKVAHTPDPDDAFMFYALMNKKVDTWLEFEHFIEDIETLNRKALKGVYEVTAISVHAYKYAKDKYRILSAGSSVGDGYGPVVVAREKIDLRGKRIAVPGKLTTAYLLLKMALDHFEPVEMRFDEVVKAVLDKKCDAALIIHDLQLVFEDLGLSKVLDLWEWWYKNFKLPLPLGLNVVRRDVESEVQKEFLNCMKESISYALKNVEEALNYAMRFSRLDKEKTKTFVLMYVNKYTYEMPENVVEALKIIYREEPDILY
ncbi:MAG: ABC transporter substrate-binding protein [Archaeoglobaceae archaeon]|nr:ABC transporter substrate-binding protein [Archaeoglobaceae archaeon]MCX8151665.1 ABC transporter substrate-binding protein [Archaeoglobaceae archaeon]MDW8013057.1 MqnA/MqnD/SBP family protein [Archaeoglobaceae archaeon]